MRPGHQSIGRPQETKDDVAKPDDLCFSFGVHHIESIAHRNAARTRQNARDQGREAPGRSAGKRSTGDNQRQHSRPLQRIVIPLAWVLSVRLCDHLGQ